MKLNEKLSAWREPFQRYAIPLAIISILAVLVFVIFEGRLSNIQQLLVPGEKSVNKTAQKPLEKSKKQIPPAGIAETLARKDSPRKPTPNSPITPGEIDQYLDSLSRRQAGGLSAEPPPVSTPPMEADVMTARRGSASPAGEPQQQSTEIKASPKSEQPVDSGDNSPPAPSPAAESDAARAALAERSDKPGAKVSAPHAESSPSEQDMPALKHWVRKTPFVDAGPGRGIILGKEMDPVRVSAPSVPALPAEKAVWGGSDLLITFGQEVWVRGKKIPVSEMIRIIREHRPSADNDLFGLRIVRKGDNIWNVHLEVITAFFLNQRGIRLPILIDEPDEEGRSSGIGKILKFSENTGVCYNFINGKIIRDPDYLTPGQEIYFFRMKDVLSVLEGVSLGDLNKFEFDGSALYYSGQPFQGKESSASGSTDLPRVVTPPAEIKIKDIR